MRILLVLAKDSTYRCAPFGQRCVSYAPLTLAVLAALVPSDLEASIDLVDEGVQSLPDGAGPYDVVGISFTTSGAPRAYELARLYRATTAKVVLGGYHASLNPEEAAEHADAVVVGPAESSWPRLLLETARAGAPSQRVYSGEVPEVLSMPVPARHLMSRRYVPFPTVLASRGCVNACAFCVTNRMWQGRPCPRPLEELVEEIRGLPSKRVVFLDSNLAAHRDSAAELFEALIPLGKRWAGAMTIDVAEDAELLDLAVRSGCDGALVGFESVNADALAACGKRTNRVERYVGSVARLHDRGVMVLGCFVLGFDEDGEDVFDKTLAFVDEARIDLPRFAVLTPFPGTRTFEQMQAQGRILTRDWSLYDERHAVFAPAKMSPEALEAGHERVWRCAFSSARIAKRVTRSGPRSPLALAYNLGFRRIVPAAVGSGATCG